MNHFLELHIIQNFSPSAPNRGEHGEIKTSLFGGYERAIVSSQADKWAIRREFRQDFPEIISFRTRNLLDEIMKLTGESSISNLEAKVTLALASIGIAVDVNRRNEYLIFLSQRELEGIAQITKNYSKALLPPDGWTEQLIKATRSKRTKAIKKEAAKLVPAEIVKELKDSFTGPASPEVAQFGRMMADMPRADVDGSCYASGYLSTHAIAPEVDYFTAVDDCPQEGDKGAGMLDEREYVSACYYRYYLINIQQLHINLGEVKDDTVKCIHAFFDATVKATPKAGQRQWANFTEPSFFAAAVGQNTLECNLANAFAYPIPLGRGDVIAESINRLTSQWEYAQGMYGSYRSLSNISCCAIDCYDLGYLAEYAVSSLDIVCDQMLSVVKHGLK